MISVFVYLEYSSNFYINVMYLENLSSCLNVCVCVYTSLFFF